MQIEAICAAVAQDRRPAGAIFVDERARPLPGLDEQPETQLARMLRLGEFVLSVQLDPPLGGSNHGLIETSRELKARGIAHVDLNDNPRARARMSGIMASVAIERFAGIETIPHLTPRDSTVVGLESLLLGAHAEGVRNVLCVTGDPPERGDYPSASGGVYQVDAIGLTEIVARLNRGEDWDGREIDAPTSFFPGVAVNPTADDLDEELRRFERKLAAGARFAMTQILFDLAYLDAFVERLGGEWPIPVLVGIWPVRSHQLAVRIHNEVPGIVVPKPVQQRLRDAGAAAPEAGLELARELLAASRACAHGAYVVAPFRQPLDVLDLFA
jgi:homocysteine S-methyltransferase